MIALVAKKETQKKYQSLLRAEWTQSSVSEVLRLLDTSFANKKYPFNGSAVEEQEALPYEKLIQYLRQYFIFLNNGRTLSTVIPKRRGRKQRKLATLGAQVNYYLAFPLLVKGFDPQEKFAGAIGFFRDLQSLLFLLAIHFVLPDLFREKMKSEHDLMLSVLYHHSQTVWAPIPSHQFYLFAQLYDYLGNREETLKYTELAFKMTAPDSHDYLTKAQEYWSTLMDHHLFQKAEKFLIALIRNCPPEYLVEIQEILRLHYELTLPTRQSA